MRKFLLFTFGTLCFGRSPSTRPLFMKMASRNISSNSNGIRITVAAASWKKNSMQLLDSIESSSKIMQGEDVELTKLLVDEDDESQEEALSLNMNEIPSVNIYKGAQLHSALVGASCTLENIESAISSARMFDDDTHSRVASAYAATVKGQESCCVSIDSTLNGYSVEDLMIAAGANLGVGCGNPLSFANLMPGETVVDLGSGAGIDCFLAGKKVGAEGRVIGVDMTPDMLFQARKNAKEGNHANVEFRLGEIEHLPVADNSVDLVISNCVINLSPSKAQVFAEIFRVLKPGGRVAISDVVERAGVTMPDSLRTAQALSCWVAGAPEVSTLDSYLKASGFTSVRIDIKEESREVIKQWLPGSGAEDFVVSANVQAIKPMGVITIANTNAKSSTDGQGSVGTGGALPAPSAPSTPPPAPKEKKASKWC